MEFNFKKVAQQATSLSPIMAGREQLKGDDLMGRELTVIGFDFAPSMDDKGNAKVNPFTGETETYGVLIFEEYPGGYYNGGAIITNICRAWLGPFESAEEASEALLNEGGVKIKLEPGRTKRGNNITRVIIID